MNERIVSERLNYRLLIVEDDHALAAMVQDFLIEQGFEVSIESNGHSAIDRIEANAFDAVVLDIGLPGASGFEVCQSVRTHFEGPILVLTARGDEVDEVEALELGADDFMSKPVRPHALLARLRVHLRRVDLNEPDEVPQAVVVGDLTIDPAKRSVWVGDQSVQLTTAEFDLLLYLANRAGKPVARTDVYLDLLKLPYDGIDRSIDLRVSRLRRKLKDDPHRPARIKSVRGVGYLLAK